MCVCMCMRVYLCIHVCVEMYLCMCVSHPLTLVFLARVELESQAQLGFRVLKDLDIDFKRQLSLLQVGLCCVYTQEHVFVCMYMSMHS